MRKLLIIIIVIVGLVGGLWAAGKWYAGTRTTAGPEAVVVRLEPAACGDLSETISAPGQVQPRNKVSISAKVSARIVELPYAEGERVTKGSATTKPSVLVKLDSKDLEAALRQAEARRNAEESQIKVAAARLVGAGAKARSTQISLAEAERELVRQKQLLSSKDVSQVAVDQAQNKVDQLNADIESLNSELKADEEGLAVMRHNLEAAKAEIERASDALSYTTIASPIDGVITRLNAKAGELVMTGTMNNAGTVILEVADLSQMLVQAKVDEASIASVQVGQKATVRMQAYPDETFEGTVESVALAQAEDPRDTSRYFKTDVLLQTGGRRIFAGLTADVDIETRQHTGVIKVPSQAVMGRPTDQLPADIRSRTEVDQTKTVATVVYRYIDGKAVVTPVTIGPSDMTHTIIKSGLSAGDAVIAGPYKVLEGLAHDQKVKPEKELATTKPTTRSTTAPATRPATAGAQASAAPGVRSLEGPISLAWTVGGPARSGNTGGRLLTPSRSLRRECIPCAGNAEGVRSLLGCCGPPAAAGVRCGGKPAVTTKAPDPIAARPC